MVHFASCTHHGQLNHFLVFFMYIFEGCVPLHWIINVQLLLPAVEYFRIFQIFTFNKTIPTEDNLANCSHIISKSSDFCHFLTSDVFIKTIYRVEVVFGRSSPGLLPFSSSLQASIIVDSVY